MTSREDLMVVLQASVARAKAARGVPVGFVCKRCGGPSPLGVGYVDHSEGAHRRSAGVSACGCGWSVVP